MEEKAAFLREALTKLDEIELLLDNVVYSEDSSRRIVGLRRVLLDELRTTELSLWTNSLFVPIVKRWEFPK